LNISIIGSGFSSLSAACYLQKMGHEVTVFEKNSDLGGRARSFEKEGFLFDMGPSWYWMPDVFESFFNDFGKQVNDYYNLVRLDPSYKVYWKDQPDNIPANFEELQAYFEKYETGSAKKLVEFLNEAKTKYKVGMGDFVTKPGLSASEFLTFDVARKGLKLNLLKSISKHIRQYFKHPKLIELLEFPVLFLGAKPSKTPALYSLMNYADMVLGTWYPMGGMNEIVKAMVAVGSELGVKYKTKSNVTSIVTSGKTATGLMVNDKFIESDLVVSGADYHFTEQSLLDSEYRNYDESYWNSRVMAPSSLLYYVGLKKEIPGLLHHNLFFDADFQLHATEIYDTHKWPENPLFYVCCPSKTDSSVAPKGKENIFMLIPVSTEIKDTEAIRQRYFNMICERLSKHIGVDIRDNIEVFESFAHSNFVDSYNSFKGNAYGLANTLKQTAILKPKCKNKKLNNLYYIGQLTVPGPGVPPAIISGKIVSELISKEHSLNSLTSQTS
jgi:phytoene desaturase